MDELSFTSVGIDIGTSTTKLIVSRLRLGRVSGASHLPRYEIVERELHYASPIYSTPLLSQDEIDMDEVARILRDEYDHIGLSLSEVKSGAVIITGEMATKTNARRVVHYLAERSGDFVVAAAGADLEGLLAGKGSGAEQRSRSFRELWRMSISEAVPRMSLIFGKGERLVPSPSMSGAVDPTG